jgi:hypothetical protein
MSTSPGARSASRQRGAKSEGGRGGGHHLHAVGIEALRVIASSRQSGQVLADVFTALAAARLARALEQGSTSVDLTGVRFTPLAAVLVKETLCTPTLGKLPRVAHLVMVDCGDLDDTAAGYLVATVRGARGIRSVQVGGSTRVPAAALAEVERLSSLNDEAEVHREQESAVRLRRHLNRLLRQGCARILTQFETLETSRRRELEKGQASEWRAAVLAQHREGIHEVERAARLATKLRDIAAGLEATQALEESSRASHTTSLLGTVRAAADLLYCALRSSIVAEADAERAQINHAARFSWSDARAAARKRTEAERAARDHVEDDEVSGRRVIESAEARARPDLERAAYLSRSQALVDSQRRAENAQREAAARMRVEAMTRELKQREAAERAAAMEAQAAKERAQREQFDTDVMAQRAALRDAFTRAVTDLCVLALQRGVTETLRDVGKFRNCVVAVEGAVAKLGKSVTDGSLATSARGQQTHHLATSAAPMCLWVGDDPRQLFVRAPTSSIPTLQVQPSDEVVGEIRTALEEAAIRRDKLLTVDAARCRPFAKLLVASDSNAQSGAASDLFASALRQMVPGLLSTESPAGTPSTSPVEPPGEAERVIIIETAVGPGEDDVKSNAESGAASPLVASLAPRSRTVSRPPSAPPVGTPCARSASETTVAKRLEDAVDTLNLSATDCDIVVAALLAGRNAVKLATDLPTFDDLMARVTTIGECEIRVASTLPGLVTDFGRECTDASHGTVEVPGAELPNALRAIRVSCTCESVPQSGSAIEVAVTGHAGGGAIGCVKVAALAVSSTAEIRTRPLPRPVRPAPPRRLGTAVTRASPNTVATNAMATWVPFDVSRPILDAAQRHFYRACVERITSVRVDVFSSRNDDPTTESSPAPSVAIVETDDIVVIDSDVFVNRGYESAFYGRLESDVGDDPRASVGVSSLTLTLPRGAAAAQQSKATDDGDLPIGFPASANVGPSEQNSPVAALDVLRELLPRLIVSPGGEASNVRALLTAFGSDGEVEFTCPARQPAAAASTTGGAF